MDWRCYADLLPSSTTKACVDINGDRTTENCNDPDGATGRFCTRTPELNAVRNSPCPDDFDMTCENTEEWTECKHECGRHCDLEAGCGIDEGPCQAGCTCKQGFFRNSEGRVAAVNPKSEIITKIQ